MNSIKISCGKRFESFSIVKEKSFRKCWNVLCKKSTLISPSLASGNVRAEMWRVRNNVEGLSVMWKGIISGVDRVQ